MDGQFIVYGEDRRGEPIRFTFFGNILSPYEAELDGAEYVETGDAYEGNDVRKLAARALENLEAVLLGLGE